MVPRNTYEPLTKLRLLGVEKMCAELKGGGSRKQAATLGSLGPHVAQFGIVPVDVLRCRSGDAGLFGYQPMTACKLVF